MIAGIKKYAFLVHHKDYSDLLDTLRKAGVVHITEKHRLDEGNVLQVDLERLNRYRSAIRQLRILVPGSAVSEQSEDPETVLAGLESLIKEIEDRKHALERLRAEADRARPWGRFDPSVFRKLDDTDWTVSLFSCSRKHFREEWKGEHAIEVISEKGSRIYFAVIHRKGEFPDLDAGEETIPERSVAAVLDEIKVNEDLLADADARLKLKAPEWNKALQDGSKNVINRIEYLTVEQQADKYAEDNLYVLEGWVPDDEEERLRKMLEDSDCYFFAVEPSENEKVPIILKNNKFASLFEPITRLYSLPDYRELDLTPFFAPFFMLFFGFCLGDAGYGLFFLIAGFIIKRKVSLKLRPFVTLAQYLGAAAMLFGMLTGTFFGMNLIDTGYTITGQSVIRMEEYGVPAKTVNELKQLKDISFSTRQEFVAEVIKVTGGDIPGAQKNAILKSAEGNFSLIRSFRHLMQDSLSMFYLAIILGAIQILFGMILKVVNISRQKGFRYSLSVIGWIVLLLTLIIFKGGAALKLLDEARVAFLFNTLLIFSLVLIFLLNTPGINVFLRIGNGIWDSYNVITGIFGDLLSYIRLFALGISSSILGFVFNDISSQMLSVPYVGWLFFIVLLLIGHSLNIFMATLGGFVHPLRLTFVEFYKNAGFSGGGLDYKPFKLK
ncbi:MAG TPA: V-type ATPase 116kDa subunit family protein [Bacteroidales bacterium]|jgi:V/A-type H+-transporting ATPase subunit I|nr:V-type ATPase 116kDa subunit family protein [Bacteroidales bacterium]HOS70926.1 V-type ATPase 116kDa subunit family protein [Bacteroidales bacterium]HQH25165.1 V-type ATPase 116kDa subunit family protein [Bacteroidales bacterium]HQJ82393.1 V-type ATPase 116kDa subunit family protein [Bacteroidales bacterium]